MRKYKKQSTHSTGKKTPARPPIKVEEAFADLNDKNEIVELDLYIQVNCKFSDLAKYFSPQGRDLIKKQLKTLKWN